MTENCNHEVELTIQGCERTERMGSWTRQVHHKTVEIKFNPDLWLIRVINKNGIISDITSADDIPTHQQIGAVELKDQWSPTALDWKYCPLCGEPYPIKIEEVDFST